MAQPDIRIDLVSDTVCPWCLIGKRRLERAVAQRRDLAVEVRWRAFQLHPDMPPEGADKAAFVARKFGSAEKARDIYRQIADVGRAEGLTFRFDRIDRAPNTLDSHRLILWSASAGCQDAVVEGLFEAYFTAGQDISDPGVLAGVAADAGMDKALVADLLASDRDRERVLAEDKAARQMGIQGVPCLIVNRRLMVQGAQEPETLIQAMDQALAPAGEV